MKLNKFATLGAAALILLFTACKKDKTNDAVSEEVETTFELSGNQAIAENLTEDANDVLNEAAMDRNLMGGRTAEDATGLAGTTGILSCATLGVTPATGFPKTLTIDFGSGCTSANGVIRSGKITVVLSDSLRRPGSTAVMTFTNYFVNGFKKEGTVTWTNTSTPGTRSWQRKVENGKITAPLGNFWLHSGVKNVTQTAGVGTPLLLLDDVFSITGNHTVTNSAGRTRTCNVLDALQKKTICENVDKGRIKLDGPNHYAIIDFGDGTCDKLANISIDGRPSRTILLR
jgi:hypothetical protein